jgi:hypothetical protein
MRIGLAVESPEIDVNSGLQFHRIQSSASHPHPYGPVEYAASQLEPPTFRGVSAKSSYGLLDLSKSSLPIPPASTFSTETSSRSSKMVKTTNIALLGTGLYAESDYIPALLAETTQHVRVHTVWSLDEAAAQKFASKLNRNDIEPRVLLGNDAIETILQDPDIDALVMVLPFMYQPPLIKRAWAAGKHVLSEKPVERDVAAGLALVREYEENWKPKGLIWRVAEGEL